MSNTVGLVVGATVTLVAIYLFVFNASGTDNIIRGAATGYSQIVQTLQGR